MLPAVQPKGITVTELRVIEICAGAGGQALGLERAGFKHELAIELDENAVSTLRENRPNWKVLHGDVASRGLWVPSSYAPHNGEGRIALLAGGVPCPPFSIAGKQLGAHDERDLFAWAVEQVREIRPRALLLENVRGLSMPRFSGYRQYVLDRLWEFGYAAEWKLVQASDYGVPQLRQRFVLVAMSPKDFAHFTWPDPLKRAPTVGEALESIMRRREVFSSEAELQEWVKGANRFAPTIVGGSKKHGGADLGPTRAKLAWAALGVDAYGLHDDTTPYRGSKRALTSIGPKLSPEMIARLQGWDDDEFKWSFTGKKTSQYRQIGNAFPPPVAKALGESIASAFRSSDGDSGKSDYIGPGAVVDPVFRVLWHFRNRSFLTIQDIVDEADFSIDASEVGRRINALRWDFEIAERPRECAEYPSKEYQLIGFRAFVGQDDHGRHEYFDKFKSRIS